VHGSVWPIIYQVHCLITTIGQGQDPSRQPIHVGGYQHRLHNFLEAERPSLNVVLDLCRKARVTDPKDKVYGILGLLPSTIASSITPDYKLPHAEVFCQFAKTLLQENNRLEAILSWCRFDENSSIPSWIPDWTTPFSRNHIQWLKRRKVAGSSTALYSISADNRYLTCRGFIFDKIHSSSSSLSENLPYRTQTRKEIDPHNAADSYQDRYGDSGALRTMLWRTLRQDHPFRHDIEKTCLDIRWIDWAALESDTDGVFHPNIWYSMETITSNVSWEVFESFRQTNADFDILGVKFKDIFPEMNPWSRFWRREESADSEHVELLGQIASDMHLTVLALTGRRLITTSGGYLGMAPEEALKDDVIAILYGCNFPVVLRSDGDRYYVIGECYVNGVMDGELMQSKDCGEYWEREITLH
jgi:hypothetical protein